MITDTASLTLPEQDYVQRMIDRVIFFGVDYRNYDGDPLASIAWLLKRAPIGFHLSAKDLEQIAHTDDTDDLHDLDGGRDIVATMSLQFEWLDGFLPNLNMWISISDSILGSTDQAKPDPKFDEQRTELNRLLTAVLSAYPLAVMEGPLYSEEEYPIRASHELLKRYWAYTRYVCAFAQQVWPDVKMDKLLQQA